MKFFILLLSLIGTTLAYNKSCGTQDVNLDLLRIVGGTIAPKNSWPWQLSLWMYSTTSRKWGHNCGAALIDENWALSAAHCFKRIGSNYHYIKVRAGEHNFTNNENHQEIAVEKVFSHPSYGKLPYNGGDIALIKLAAPANLSDARINVACMPDKVEHAGDFFADKVCYATGWGMTSGTYKTRTNILRQVKAPVVKNSVCNQSKYGYHYGRVQSTQVCFGTSTKGGCFGDSGGPMVCKVNGHFILVGVTSWGNRYCRTQPTVYTRITSWIDWVQGVMDAN